MQLGYSQFSHSQLYLRPFSLPMTHDPNIVANKTQRTNKQKTTRKQEREAHSNTLVTSLTKRTVSGCDSVKHSSRWRWFFFIIFFFFLKKVQKTGYLEKSVAFFFFSVTWELKWTGRGEKGGTTLQPIKKSPNPFCPPPKNYYHFLPSRLGIRCLPNTSQKYKQVFSE